MKKTITFKDGTTRNFETNLSGFIEAVSFKESSSDLSLSLNHPINLWCAKKINDAGYLGLFQWGESALYELGYYLGDKGISYEDIKKAKKGSALHENWKNQFDSNNWSGHWSGKKNINSKFEFLNNPQIQYEVIKEWINYLCKQIRNNNLNEHFGRVIQGVEINESGVIAGMHLVGIGGLGAFLGVSKFSSHKQTDGNGTHIKKYIQDFGGFDLEQCCNRKIYINLKDKNEKALINKEVTVVSIYSGKSFSAETKVRVKSDENGSLPVIVRHPSTEIKIVADGKESNPIIQKADQKQIATLKDFDVSIFQANLEENNTPQSKPQSNKTPQEVRNEQNTSEEKKEVVTGNIKDVSFNIQIIEEDTKKAISNMGFYLTYKGNIKKHTADSSGTKKGVVAEVGEDIEVSVSGAGQRQKIHHFKVEQSLSNQTVKIKLPVCFFKINVKENNENVTNTLVSIFYRNKQIAKRTDSNGDISVKMLLGFVFGFGIKNKELEKVRVLKGIPIRHFKVNEGFVKASKLYEIADQKRKEADELKKKSDQMQRKKQLEAQEKEAKEQAERAKSEAEKNQPIQDNTYTENGGEPLTTVSNQSPPTSDTTRYHIYHDGKIKRENKAATGYAEFIYYDSAGRFYNLGKSQFVVADKWQSKGVKAGGNTYLIDQRKHKYYKSGSLGYKWNIISGDGRYYLSGLSMSAVLGAMCNLGYAEYIGSGFSCRDGSPGESVSHLNGINGDFRYIAINNRHMTEVTYTSHDHFDWNKNVAFVEELFKFGYKLFGSHPVKIKKNALLPHSQSWKDHNHHIHLHNFSPKVEDL
ncbi:MULTISPECIES: hypothetical protein [unclassified Acinetobacter]|uniref:hypothetical protein n=1 Tax=unclassified Acinetobacter TaxID=196816 RepID=UPI0015D27291|nr:MULTISPECIES: hypothetical protein [unclassified Acinetobacter]